MKTEQLSKRGARKKRKADRLARRKARKAEEKAKNRRAYELSQRAKSDRIKDLNAYRDRDKLLKELGYPTYGDYLKSQTWFRIRAEAIGRNQGSCFKCGNRAQTAHHINYSKNTLLGKSKGGVVAICFKCHQSAEVTSNGRKNTLGQANRAMGLN